MRAAQHAHPADAVPAIKIGRFSCAILDLKVFPTHPAARLMRRRWAERQRTPYDNALRYSCLHIRSNMFGKGQASRRRIRHILSIDTALLVIQFSFLHSIIFE